MTKQSEKLLEEYERLCSYLDNTWTDNTYNEEKRKQEIKKQVAKNQRIIDRLKKYREESDEYIDYRGDAAIIAYVESLLDAES